MGARAEWGLAAPMICTSSVGLATGMTGPFLALRLDQMGFDGGSIGLNSSVQTAAALAVSPLLPALLCRWGVARLLGFALLAIVICLMLFPSFPGFASWAAIRAVFGASVAVVSVAAPTWVTGMAPRLIRGRTVGFFGLLWSAGFALGPSLIWLSGRDAWRPFQWCAALVAAALLSLSKARGGAPVVLRAAAAQWGSVLRRLVTPALAAGLVLGLLDAANDSFLPLYGIRNGLDEHYAVSMLVVLQTGATLAQLPVGWIADRINRTRLMWMLTLIALIGVMMLPWAVHQARCLFADILFLGFGIGGIWTTSIVLLAEEFTDAERAVVTMARAFLYGLGGIVLLPLLGFGIDAFGARIFPTCVLSALLVLGFSCWRAMRLRRRSD